MPRRYVFPSAGGRAAALLVQVPGATVTDFAGAIEMIVPDVAVPTFERALPATPSLVEPVAALTPTMVVGVRADLLVAAQAVQTVANLQTILTDAAARNPVTAAASGKAS